MINQTMMTKQEKNKKLIQIGKAAQRAGISRQSLQYYLMLGLLEPTHTSDTGRRMFDEKAVEKIKLIKNLNKSGYPLRAIRDLFMNSKQSADIKEKPGD
jgi:DNA-binding transcriptional MerR regulator